MKAVLLSRAVLLGSGLAGALALAGTGCDTNAYCFDCPTEDGTGTSTDTNTGAGGEDQSSSTGFVGSGGSSGLSVSAVSASGAGGGCVSENPTELCNNIDDDCNGEVDDNIDFTDPRQCGNCDTNCFVMLLNVNPDTITCESPEEPGTPGACAGECAADYYDRDGDGNCEAFCVKASNDDATCDNRDSDCDALIDEDVDVCTDNQNCGICGRQCESPNATTECVPDDDANGDCDDSNTRCEIQACDAGYVDANGNYQDGCELPCVPDETTDGVEFCGDQIDNDCDGAIDAADTDLSGDPYVGEDCFGGQEPGGDVPDGLCGDPANTGEWICQAGPLSINGYTCFGGNVVHPNTIPETCNDEDDDCDSLVDDNPTDDGGVCGSSSIAPCRRGTFQCLAGGDLECVGAIEPGIEVCNGRDDDCDGVRDDNATDVGGDCNVPPPPPAGATSPCQGGTLICNQQTGAVECSDDILAQSTDDTCGVDANCDGNLTNQPDLDNDVRNCGTCDNDCFEGQPVGQLFTCETGDCTPAGCAPGYVDLPGGAVCEYQCTPTGPEICNGLDDDCDNVPDNTDTIAKPSPTQVCGVNPTATRPECTTGVAVNCQQVNNVWGWQCTFPNTVCPGGCSAGDEICEAAGLDNDCDGLVNENVPNFGANCFSDDAAPNPGHGACRRAGTYRCATPTTTTCSAVKAACTANPGGCAEVCDGIDNDCDESVDEPYTAKGTNAAFWYQPDVMRIATGAGTSRWMMAYEASRPDATPTTAGIGNGYVTDAPMGVTRDATPACSEPNRLPWFNVTPDEVEQTCTMMGGHICAYTTEWRVGCGVDPPVGASCTWGYAPYGVDCRSPNGFTATKYCNIAPAFDFDTSAGAPGDQDGLLPTGDLLAENCYSDWSGVSTANTAVADRRLYDMTGNLREIVLDGSTYRVVGGAFNTQAEDGATCNFSFYSVPDDFKFFDTGFRCCFDADPRL